jgi:hypothetical protein
VEEKKLNVKEAAEFLRFKSGAAYIYQLIAKDPTFPYHKRPGKKPRGGGIWFIQEELRKWEDSRSGE